MKLLISSRLFAASTGFAISSLLLLIIMGTLPLSTFADEVAALEGESDPVILMESHIAISGTSSTQSTGTRQGGDTGILGAHSVSTIIANEDGAVDATLKVTTDRSVYADEERAISRYKNIPFSVVLVLVALISLVPIARRNLKGL